MGARPICPVCKIEMEIHDCMGGDTWFCDNYNFCGQMKRITASTNKTSKEVNNGR